jgi:hypothetical protein
VDSLLVPYPGTVMDGAGQGYAPPEVRDYGDLVALTKADTTLLHLGLSSTGIAAASAPVPPGGGGTVTTPEAPLGGELPGGTEGGSLPGGGAPAGGGDSGATLGGDGSGGDGGGSGGDSGGGDGGSLPFTGFAVAVVGAIGSGMSAAGLALRRRLSRGQSPD